MTEEEKDRFVDRIPPDCREFWRERLGDWNVGRWDIENVTCRGRYSSKSSWNCHQQTDPLNDRNLDNDSSPGARADGLWRQECGDMGREGASEYHLR